MNNTVFVTFSLFAFSTITFLASAYAETKTPQAANSTIEIQESKNQIVKLTDKGIEPSELRIKKEDSVVFFLNDTLSSLTSLVIEFGEKATHCGGAKMQTGKHGRVSSVRPFGPNDFTSTCFHEAGIYPIKVYGLKTNPKGIEGKVYVE